MPSCTSLVRGILRSGGTRPHQGFSGVGKNGENIEISADKTLRKEGGVSLSQRSCPMKCRKRGKVGRTPWIRVDQHESVIEIHFRGAKLSNSTRRGSRNPHARLQTPLRCGTCKNYEGLWVTKVEGPET